jgi:hypothetical protein
MAKQPINRSLSQVAGIQKLFTLSQPARDCVLQQKPVMGSELSKIRIHITTTTTTTTTFALHSLKTTTRSQLLSVCCSSIVIEPKHGLYEHGIDWPL